MLAYLLYLNLTQERKKDQGIACKILLLTSKSGIACKISLLTSKSGDSLQNFALHICIKYVHLEYQINVKK